MNLYLSLIKNTNKEDEKIIKIISNAIQIHFKVYGWLDEEKAKKLLLNEIFKDKDTESDLLELYKNYVWENRDWNKLPEKWKLKVGVKWIWYPDFVNKFNKKTNTLYFNRTVDNGKLWENMNKARVNAINEYVNSIMWGKGNEFLMFESNKLRYSIERVKKFLRIINEKNFNKIARDGESAWISAVQLLYNENTNGNLKINGVYKKWWDTYRAILNFQKIYNKTHSDKLQEDWVPWPRTLAKLLSIKSSNWWSLEWIDTTKFDEYELRILKVDSSNFYEWYNYKREEIEANHRYKRWRIIENIEKYVQSVIGQKRDISKKEIIENVRSDLITLPVKQKAEIILWVHKVVEKFNKICKYLDFKNWPYKSPKALLCAMRWIKDQRIISKITNDITVKQHWVWLTFFIWDENSYYIIYGRWTPGWKWSWWFNEQRSAIKDLDSTLSVVNWKNPGNDTSSYQYWTILHEWQHNRNSYFMPDKDYTPIHRAKDEITAYLRDGRTIQMIEKCLTQDKSKWWLYQYDLKWEDWEKHKQRVKQLLQYASDLIALTKKNIWLTRDNVISMLSDTPEKWWKNLHDKVIQAVKDWADLNEFWWTWTAKKETEINEINLANSINEIKHILCDPKYSHISRWPNHKWWIEVAAVIDKVVELGLDTKFIPSEIRAQVQKFINK